MSASKLALLGGEPVGAPRADQHPTFSDRAIERVVEHLRAGRTVGLNRNVDVIAECEAAICAWHGVEEALGVSSGHAALHCALMGLEISTGDEVICTPYTWGASISCVLHAGAIPVFCDVDPVTGLMDPESIEAAITPRTKAVLPVHIYGQPAPMTAIVAVARKRGLAVIEDGSQAHGALHAGEKVGQFGDAAGFSCMGGKIVATTEAGYLLCHDKAVYWKAALNTQHYGRSPEPDFPDDLREYVDSLVHTYRIGQLNAVLMTEQFRKVDAENAGRRANVASFRKAMAGVASVSFADFPAGDDPVYYAFAFNFVPAAAGLRRDTYLRALRAEGVSLGTYVPEPIQRWRRMRWQDYDGPPIFWMDNLRRAGIDYAGQELANVRTKVERSLHLGWSYIADDPARMASLAAPFQKVEEQLDALRAWERSEVVA